MPLPSIPLRITPPRRSLRFPRTVMFEDFLGLGINDASFTTDPRFSPYMLNMTINPQGVLERRWGCATLGTLAGGAVSGYWSAGLQLGFVQVGLNVYKTTGFASFTSIATLSSSAAGFFTDYLGKLVFVHPADGVFTYDGTTWVNSTATVKGTMAAVWQNKLWVAGDPGAATMVKWTDAGTMTFGASNFVLFRDVDDTPLTAIGAGQGFDALAKPTLLVFKRHSTHRVNDSSTGAYVTLSAEAGCVGPRALAATGGRVVFFGDTGIWVTNGLSIPQRVSGPIQRWFVPTDASVPFSYELNTFLDPNRTCAGVRNGRVIFAFARAVATADVAATGNFNVALLEYDPLRGSFMPYAIKTGLAGGDLIGYGQVGIADFINYRTSSATKLFAVTDGASSVFQALDMFKVGTYQDVGSAYLSRFRTALAAPPYFQFRASRLTVRGNSNGSATVAPTDGSAARTWGATPSSGLLEAATDFFEMGTTLGDGAGQQGIAFTFESSSISSPGTASEPMVATQFLPNMRIRSIEAELVPMGRI